MNNLNFPNFLNCLNNMLRDQNIIPTRINVDKLQMIIFIHTVDISTMLL
jgi:hypothetical protein